MIILVMGVAGSGKSTVGRALAARLGWSYAEADDFHPAENVEKMARGFPLSDADRAPWLAAIAAWIRTRVEAGEPGVVTCSALKRAYRDVLRLAARDGTMRLVYLRGTKDLLARRIAARTEHFFGAAMLESQLEALEEPREDEEAVVVDIDAPPEGLVETIRARLADEGALP